MFTQKAPCPSFEDTEKAWERLLPDQEIRQICSYKLPQHPEEYEYLATPEFLAKGCEGGHYRSFIVGRRPSDRAIKATINSDGSFSGDLVLKAWLSQHQMEDIDIHKSGSHLQSLQRIIEGQVDLAAIDALSFAFAKILHPELGKVPVLAWSDWIPGHPAVALKNSGAPAPKIERTELSQLPKIICSSIELKRWVYQPEIYSGETFKNTLRFQANPHQSLLYDDL